MAEIKITVSGPVGCGKSAIAGEIEIALLAIGVPVRFADEKEMRSEKNMTHADWAAYLEMYKPSAVMEERIEQPDAQHDIATLSARVAELEAENAMLLLDRSDLIEALQPLLGCADYAREQDLSGHETLIVTANEAYEAASTMTRIESRAALSNGRDGNG